MTHDDLPGEGGPWPGGKPPTLVHEVEGEGPAVVLLNGGLMSIRAWDPVASRLAAAPYQVVRLDFRGQLRSPGPVPATLAGHARDVVHVLDVLGIEQAHLVGTSYGALVALVAADEFGSRVKSVVAMTATDRVTSEMRSTLGTIRHAALEAAAGGDGGRVLDLLAPATFSATYLRERAADLAARREVIRRLPPSWYEGLAGLLGAIEQFDIGPRAATITMPVLVLAAEHDLTFPLAHSRSLAAVLPDGRLQVLPGAAHGAAVEQPEAVTEAVLAFLGEVEAGRAG